MNCPGRSNGCMKSRKEYRKPTVRSSASSTTERNRKLYRVTDNHGNPEYIGYLWKKDFFFCTDGRLFLEECLYRGVSQADIEGKTERFGEFAANLGLYLTEY